MTSPTEATNHPVVSDGEATKRILEEAALELLEEEGVLAGLNLREVAHRAGVNRGLVYHYFGSRQELLRAALRRDMTIRLAAVSAGERLPFRQRMGRFLRTMIGEQRVIRLASLLLLDHDPSVRLTPMRKRTLAVLQSDVDAGSLEQDVDLEAMHATVVATVYGYVLYRKHLAREARTTLGDLDARVEAVLDRMLSAFSEPAAGEVRTSDDRDGRRGPAQRKGKEAR